MNLPKKIDPCPIIEALIEIRFSALIHENAVFGLFYNVLKEDFPKVESLPILQLPEPLRMADPNLKFKPHYKIINQDFIVQIGPDVFSIASVPKYIGWGVFSNKIFDILSRINQLKVINDVLRLGIRYINFFEEDIFNDIDLSISLKDNKIDYKNTVIRTEISQEDFSSSLQIANNVNNVDRIGSVIDIDTFTSLNLDKFFSNKETIINRGHQKEKELFFSLLKEEFLKKLNPNYE